MSSKLFILISAVILAGNIAISSAKADQITLGDSCTGTLSATTVPATWSGSVSSCLGNFEQGNTAVLTDSHWSLTNTSSTTASFTFGDAGNLLSGTLNLTNAGLGCNGNGTLCGFLTVSGITGSGPLSEFTVGGTYA